MIIFPLRENVNFQYLCLNPLDCIIWGKKWLTLNFENFFCPKKLR